MRYRVPGNFSEEFYLDRHPDVAAAVAAGRYASGRDHYLKHGWQEWREVAPAKSDARKNRDAFVQTEFASLKTIERRTKPIKFRITESIPGVANVFIPALDNELFFGGYIAFLNFLVQLSRRGMQIRFIVMEQGSFSQDEFRTFKNEERWGGAFENATMLNASRRDILAQISRNDQFFAYSCWTTLDAAPLAAACGKKVVFFIQEYEPIFHSYDSLHFIANSAYSIPHVAIFNSHALRDYFLLHKIGVFSGPQPEYLVFEHAIVLPPEGAAGNDGKPALLFYARPEAHAARNLFAVGVLALRECARRRVITPRWVLTGIGATSHYSVDIAPGIKLRGLPKAPLAQYHQMIQNYSLGLSLMAAPHPGVVHFEWAASGLPTVVNITPERPAEFFAAYSANLIPANPSVSGIADAIERAVRSRPPGHAMEIDRLPNPRSWEAAFDAPFFSRLFELI